MIYPSPSAAGKLRLDSGWSGCRLCLKMWKLASWQAPVSLPATFLMCLLFIITWTWCNNASKKAKIGSVHGSSSYPEDRTKWTSISSPATSPTISPAAYPQFHSLRGSCASFCPWRRKMVPRITPSPPLGLEDPMAAPRVKRVLTALEREHSWETPGILEGESLQKP